MTTETANVSIIVTYYDHAEYLRDAVVSALGQTVDVEVIVVDDCSPTTSAEDLLADLHVPNLTVVRLEENRGPAEASNRGVERARTDHLVILDSDDLLEPDFAASALDCMGKAGCDGAYTQVQVFGDMDFMHTPEMTPLNIMSGWPGPTTFLFRRAVHTALGGYKPSVYHHDNEFWLAALERGFRFERLDRPLYRRRLHARGRSRRQRSEELPALVREHRELFVSNLEEVVRRLEQRYWQAVDWQRQALDAYNALERQHRELREAYEAAQRMASGPSDPEGEPLLAARTAHRRTRWLPAFGWLRFGGRRSQP